MPACRFVVVSRSCGGEGSVIGHQGYGSSPADGASPRGAPGSNRIAPAVCETRQCVRILGTVHPSGSAVGYWPHIDVAESGINRELVPCTRTRTWAGSIEGSPACPTYYPTINMENPAEEQEGQLVFRSGGSLDSSSSRTGCLSTTGIEYKSNFQGSETRMYAVD
jgi:hypothetical protein